MINRICSVSGCNGAHCGKGLCSMHYTRVKRHGHTALPFKKPTGGLQDRHFEKYFPDPNTGCWLWEGKVDSRSYGLIYIGKIDGKVKYVLAHRAFYERFRGKIPEKMTLDHLCFQPCCVNPDHLEPKTLSENCSRQRSSLKKFCKNGHEFTEDNTIIRKGNGRRDCRSCGRAAQRKYQKRKAA